MEGQLFIHRKAILSAVHQQGSLQQHVSVTDGDVFRANEPDYSSLLNAQQIRRGSRIMKMGLATALSATQGTDVSSLDAIIAGTGMGSLEDSEKFLRSMVESGETALSPSPFIQSTHNTVAGQVAIQLGCHAYNMTYSQRSATFESVLYDALLMSRETTNPLHILCMAFDEISPIAYQVLERSCFWNRSYNMSGQSHYIPGGEIVASFLLSNIPAHSRSVIYASRVVSSDVLSEQELFFSPTHGAEKYDAVILGFNGHNHTDKILQQVIDRFFTTSSQLHFKPYSGENFTMMAFALALADDLICGNPVPPHFFINDSGCEVKNVLIVNPTDNHNLSLLSVGKC